MLGPSLESLSRVADDSYWIQLPQGTTFEQAKKLREEMLSMVYSDHPYLRPTPRQEELQALKKKIVEEMQKAKPSTLYNDEESSIQDPDATQITQGAVRDALQSLEQEIRDIYDSMYLLAIKLAPVMPNTPTKEIEDPRDMPVNGENSEICNRIREQYARLITLKAQIQLLTARIEL